LDGRQFATRPKWAKIPELGTDPEAWIGLDPPGWGGDVVRKFGWCSANRGSPRVSLRRRFRWDRLVVAPRESARPISE